MPWELKPDRPIYAQLIEQLERKICSGAYPLGTRLPSVRDLAQEASVNPNTMQRALARLEEDGLLYTNRTSGRIRQTKTKLAQEQVQEFLKKMTDLGFQQKEIRTILISITEELKK